MALVHSGNYVAGAHRDGRLVGGLVGWLGGPPREHLHLHSHILGVVNESQSRGLRFDLKQHQRRWCLERGNAYFNFNRLGAEASEYLVNLYGAMPDGINAGEESDRIVISWRLDSRQAEEAAAGRPHDPAADDLQSGKIDSVLSLGVGGEPVRGSSGARVIVCQVPEDIVAM